MAGNWYVWDGSIQRPVRFDGWWNGTAVQPVYAPNPTYTTGTRLAREWPFQVPDAANVSVGSGATFEGSGATQTAAFLAVTPYINQTNWSVRIFRADVEDPFVNVLHPSTSADMGSMFIPAGSASGGGTDQHVAIIQPDGRTVYELYQFVRISDTSYTSSYVHFNDLHGTALNKGTRASGTSILMGLIRKEELAAESIPHTLSISLPGSALLSGFVWPARAEDGDSGSSYTGPVPMGSMFAIPSTTDLATLGLSSLGLALGVALQDFGGHVMIRGDNCALYAENDADSGLVSNARTQWAILQPYMRRVTNNTSVNIAGGGTRRRSAAPAIYSPMYGTPMTPQ